MPGFLLAAALAALAASAATVVDVHKLRGSDEAVEALASTGIESGEPRAQEVWQPVRDPEDASIRDTDRIQLQQAFAHVSESDSAQPRQEAWPEAKFLGDATTEVDPAASLQAPPHPDAAQIKDSSSNGDYSTPAPPPDEVVTSETSATHEAGWGFKEGQPSDDAASRADAGAPQQEAWQAVLAARTAPAEPCPLALHDVQFPRPEAPGPLEQMLDMSFDRRILQPWSSPRAAFAFKFGPQVQAQPSSTLGHVCCCPSRD